MYPDDQLLEIFGEQVMYPGLDPETQKFTDGDFSNPLKKPSYIPAETFNLIIDNIENVVSAMGLEPNNTDPEQFKKALQRGFAPRSIGEYHPLDYEPSVAELVRLRYLPLDYRIIKIALYKELCDLQWVGTELNNTALFWYKCDEDGSRNVDGLFMRVRDTRGVFLRAAGKNDVFKAANNTPYDGGDIGKYIQDRIQNIVGNTGIFAVPGVGVDTGALYLTGEVTNAWNASGGIARGYNLAFDASRTVRTGKETAPASLSVLYCISY
jgi:hypothetical protein